MIRFIALFVLYSGVCSAILIESAPVAKQPEENSTMSYVRGPVLVSTKPLVLTDKSISVTTISEMEVVDVTTAKGKQVTNISTGVVSEVTKTYPLMFSIPKRVELPPVIKEDPPLTDKEKEPLPKEKDNGIIGGVIAGVAALGAGGYYVLKGKDVA